MHVLDNLGLQMDHCSYRFWPSWMYGLWNFYFGNQIWPFLWLLRLVCNGQELIIFYFIESLRKCHLTYLLIKEEDCLLLLTLSPCEFRQWSTWSSLCLQQNWPLLFCWTFSCLLKLFELFRKSADLSLRHEQTAFWNLSRKLSLMKP